MSSEQTKDEKNIYGRVQGEDRQVCQTGSRSIGQVAKDLDLSENSVRRWVAQAEVDEGRGEPGALTTEEKSELTALRGRWSSRQPSRPKARSRRL